MQSKNSPLDVTVVIPSYNRSGLITRALESVRNQHNLPARIIVVDDASSDGTPDIVRRWAKETGLPVTVEVLEENGGPAKARNRGIALADTEYIAFLDSDDEHLPSTLSRLVAPLEHFPDAALSFADATVVTPRESIAHGLFRLRINLDVDSAQLDLPDLELRLLKDATSSLIKASIIPTSATCFRREAALSAGLMPEDFRSGEDWLFWLRLSQKGKFVFQLHDLARHHRHDENLTHGRAAELMAREKLRGFIALLDGSLGVDLTPAQTSRARQLQKESLASWRYHLSRLGLKTYLCGIDSTLGRQTGSLYQHIAKDPKSLLRSLAHIVARP